MQPRIRAQLCYIQLFMILFKTNLIIIFLKFHYFENRISKTQLQEKNNNNPLV